MQTLGQSTMIKVFAIVILLGMITAIAAYQAFPELFDGMLLIPSA